MREKWTIVRDIPHDAKVLVFQCQWEDEVVKPSMEFPGMKQVTIYRNTERVFFSRRGFWSGNFYPLGSDFSSEELETIHG